MFNATVTFADGSNKDIKLLENEENGIKSAILKRDALDFKKVNFIDVLVNIEDIRADDEGFFIMPGGWWNSKIHDCAIGYFNKREDTEFINYDPHLYVVGINHNNKAYIAIASGMREISHQRVLVIGTEEIMEVLIRL